MLHPMMGGTQKLQVIHFVKSSPGHFFDMVTVKPPLLRTPTTFRTNVGAPVFIPQSNFVFFRRGNGSPPRRRGYLSQGNFSLNRPLGFLVGIKPLATFLGHPFDQLLKTRGGDCSHGIYLPWVFGDRFSRNNGGRRGRSVFGEPVSVFLKKDGWWVVYRRRRRE